MFFFFFFLFSFSSPREFVAKKSSQSILSIARMRRLAALLVVSSALPCVPLSLPSTSDFPLLSGQSSLTYLDSSATSQRSEFVMGKMREFEEQHNANVHRGAHRLSREATEMYESARSKIVKFINADSRREVVFTRGATESLNLIAKTFCPQYLKDGDEIVLSIMEHHSNIVPWQMYQKFVNPNVIIKFCDVKDGQLDYDHLESLMTPKTKVVSIVHTSNALGCTTDAPRISSLKNSLCHPDCIYIADGCQSLPHRPIDVKSMGCDFFVASSHKMCGPTGVGLLYGRESVLESLNPFMGGGEMIDQVTTQGSTWADLPGKFEAGTPCITQAIGFGHAVDYLESLGGMEEVHDYMKRMSSYLYDSMKDIPGVTVYGPSDPSQRSALCSFSVEGIHVSDISSFLDLENVAIRAGHHCTQPLHTYLGVSHTARASCYIYNDEKDIDVFVEKLKETIDFLGEASKSLQ